jgi:hypothetical protein
MVSSIATAARKSAACIGADERPRTSFHAAKACAITDRRIGEIETMQASAASPSLRHGNFAEFQHQAEAALALRQSGRSVGRPPLTDRHFR